MTQTKAFIDDTFDENEIPEESELGEQIPREEFRRGSLLGIDIGSINTRAALFDIVEGRARFLAAGKASTTARAPLFDSSEGVRMAVEKVERIAGREIMGEDGRPYIPSMPTGEGTDFLASTLSAGRPLKTVVVGLLDEVSLASVTNLAKTAYAEIIASIGLNNAQKPEEYINTIQRVRPDIVLIAGGTDDGATHSVLRLVNLIGMALYLMPKGDRPEVVFAGNPALATQVQRFMEPLTTVDIAPNIRPTLSAERLGPAQAILTDAFRHIHIQKVSGIAELNSWSGGNLMPTASAIGRVTRFFSKIVPTPGTSGVLAVDVGASSTVVAGSFDGDLRLRVFPGLGMGEGLAGVLKNSQVEEVLQWIPGELSPDQLIDYIQNKITHPATLPVTQGDLYIEQALARVILARALQDSLPAFPKNATRLEANTLPSFDPIVVSGGVFTNAPSPAHSLMMILDALQPTGIQRILLDINHLAPCLGAAAAVVPALVSQLLLDPTVMLNLGFVISPIGRVRQGSSVLRLRVQYQSGHETTVNVHQGNIQTIPIPAGQRAKVFIDPLHRTNIGYGPGKPTSIQVVGGMFGLVVDARGRPLKLPDDPETRRNQLLKWQSSFALKSK